MNSIKRIVLIAIGALLLGLPGLNLAKAQDQSYYGINQGYGGGGQYGFPGGYNNWMGGFSGGYGGGGFGGGGYGGYGYNQSISRVIILDARYRPQAVAVQPYSTIMWINYDNIPHTVTSTNGYFDSGTIYPGQSYTTTVGGSGSYSYYCKIHPDIVGQIVVY